MYNYIFEGDINKNPNNYLIFIKRLMPRWVNCIPDAECIAIFEVLKKLRLKKKRPLNLIETGCGASTIAMIVHCCIYGGKVFSWDINQSRGLFLRSVFSESIGTYFKKDINQIWTFVGFNSIDQNIGISIFNELKKKADFGFFDSLHTTDHVKKELNEFLKIASKNFIVAFDDAYFNTKHTNEGYINMMRFKLNLKKIIKPPNNISKEIWEEAYILLKQRFKKVKKLKTSFEKNYQNDLYFEYFSPDQEFTQKIGMWDEKKISKTFIAFEVN